MFHLRLIQSETGVLYHRLSLSARHLQTTDVTMIQIIFPRRPQFVVYLYFRYRDQEFFIFYNTVTLEISHV